MAYIGDSRVADLLRNRLNRNLTSRGYPSSYTQTGTNGLNLTDLGYPSSTEGYYGGNVSTTNLAQALATMASGRNSSGSRSSGSYSTLRSAGDGVDNSAYENTIAELEAQLQRLRDNNEHDSEERQKDREQQDRWRKEDREERER